MLLYQQKEMNLLMRKYSTRLLVLCFFITVIITGCSSSDKQGNDKDNLLKDGNVNVSNNIKMINIANMLEEKTIFIDNKEELQVFINVFTTSKLINNPPCELKPPPYIVNIYYGGTKTEEYFLYLGKDQGSMIGNGNDNAYDLTYKSVLELNKLLEKYNNK